ncbi:MAG TPA: PilZ domain-containing protein [Methylovirgula sp.]|nr:PilZ domain-containing protein [Methylovirgula sp.]
MIDRRQHQRRKTYLGGRIEFKGGLSHLECVIRNTSGNGARLALPQTIVFPQEFVLEVFSRRVKLPVRVKWIDDGACGVEFVH